MNFGFLLKKSDFLQFVTFDSSPSYILSVIVFYYLKESYISVKYRTINTKRYFISWRTRRYPYHYYFFIIFIINHLNFVLITQYLLAESCICKKNCHFDANRRAPLTFFIKIPFVIYSQFTYIKCRLCIPS